MFQDRKTANVILMKDKIYKHLLDNLEIGCLLFDCHSNKPIYINNVAQELLSTNKKVENDLISSIICDNMPLFLQNGRTRESIDGRIIEIRAMAFAQYIWLTITDDTDITQMENISNHMKELNKEFQTVFGEYGDENIMITDGKGTILYVGDNIVKTCDVHRDYFLGKNVLEIEKEKIFYPSVTVKVLKDKTNQVILQKTKNNEQLVTIGTPLFNKNGEVENVVSVTKDFSTQLKISEMLVNLDKDSLVKKEKAENHVSRLVTCDEKMFQIKQLISSVAPTKSTVLISGETGTGKDVIARSIVELSTRIDQPFIQVNCGTISTNIVESELFGYEPGSFTGANKGGKIGLIEAANGGTLFLDEISELPLEQQVKLLHVLQERVLTKVGGTHAMELDVRIIAATNKNLSELIDKGEFREDLYYRLNVVPIYIPPLRERRGDVLLLCKHFLKKYNETTGKKKRLSVDALERLRGYDWPGNVRELENTIERLVVTTPTDLIDFDALPNELKKNDSAEKSIQVSVIMDLEEAVKETEVKVISMALEKYETITKAAEAIGANQSTLSRKINKYGLCRNKTCKNA